MSTQYSATAYRFRLNDMAVRMAYMVIWWYVKCSRPEMFLLVTGVVVGLFFNDGRKDYWVAGFLNLVALALLFHSLKLDYRL